MRSSFGLLLMLLALLFVGDRAIGQVKDKSRLGLALEADSYPQGTPKELVASMIKALKRERYDYLAAHLIEPKFIDGRVLTTMMTLDQIAREIKDKFASQPEITKELLKLLNDGELTDGGDEATVAHKDVKRQLSFKKIGERWFVENERKAKE